MCLIGYCLGGTLLGAALGVMAAKKDKGGAHPLRQGAFRARRLRPHCRHRQSADGDEQVLLLDQHRISGRLRIHGSRRRARHEGSWWNDWQAWIDENNGGVKVAARVPGDGKLEVIEDAPSAYVSLRLEAEKEHKTGSGEKKQG